jgi:antitoxin (DNA-binding transcriptional repressor) of toxin-antitoxin stability system
MANWRQLAETGLPESAASEVRSQRGERLLGVRSLLREGPMSKVDVEQARERLPELIEEAMAGGDVVIMKDEKPLVRLVLVPTEAPRRKRTFGSAKGLIEMSEDFDEPLEDFREYMG